MIDILETGAGYDAEGPAREAAGTGDSAIEESSAEDWQTLMFTYESALKEVSTKIDILKEEFIRLHNYNPIEHVTWRIKSPESIVRKLKNHGLEANMANMQAYLSDIAGIRVVCSFTDDIYRIADRISQQEDIEVLTVKNYISNPKPSGYQSYHMIILVPVYLYDGVKKVKVEVQIRTIAMDFWASLEHKIQYKFEGKAPDHINEELRGCADIVNMLDTRMRKLNEEVQALPSADRSGEDSRREDELMQSRWKQGTQKTAVQSENL